MREEVLEKVFDIKTVRVISALMTKRGRFYLRDLSRESGVSLATTYRIIQKLKKIDIVFKEGKEKIEFYELNRNSELFKVLCKIFKEEQKSAAEIIKGRLHELHGLEPRVYVDKNNNDKIIVVSSLTEKKEIKTIQGEVDESEKVVLFSNSQFIEMKNAGFVNSKKLNEI